MDRTPGLFRGRALQGALALAALFPQCGEAQPVADAAPADTGTPPADTGTPPADTGTPPVDTGTPPVDTGTPPVDSGRDVAPTDTGPAGPTLVVGVPNALDAATVAHVQEVRRRGVSLGNRPDVFAKIGDSITESRSFLGDFGDGFYMLGRFSGLQPTIDFFGRVMLFKGNSFRHPSASATAGWTSDDALAGPLVTELTALRPMYAIVMYGTNDIDRSDLGRYTTNMNRIVDLCEGRGTVVLLSTIPDRLDGTSQGLLALQFNDALRRLASTRRIPLIDFWQALQPLPRRGLDEDGIHPNIFRDDGDPQSATFTDVSLRFGYNQRNLTALVMLERMRAIP